MSKVYIHLDEEINTLKSMLLDMGKAVKRAVKLAVQAFHEKDFILAQQVVDQDCDVDVLEVDIDELCFKILALQQPIAIDLRFVSGSLKINNDLERVGDFASKIAKEVIRIGNQEVPKVLNELDDLYILGQKMIHESLESFIKRDVELARKVIESDVKMDRIYEKLVNQIAPIVEENPKSFKWGVGLMDIAKGFERIGDHATNIAEQSVYLEKGEIIKHTY